jgi:type II secretory pathway pseudopilin PulG
MRTRIPVVLLAIAVVSVAVVAQTGAPATAPARSQDESVSLGYMHTVVNAQKNYKKKYGQYATSLEALVHSGSFTRRMANTDRGAYTVQFHGKPEAYWLVLIPKQFDPDHRAFYVDETGKIRVAEDQPASAESPVLK